MKKFPVAFTMFFPYVIFAMLLICTDVVDIVDMGVLIVFSVTSILVSTAFVIAVIVTAIKMVFKWNSEKALFYNTAVKIVYVPAHLMLFFAASMMGNPFLFAFMFVPIVISFMLLCATGVIAVAGIIKGYYEKKYTLPVAIVYGILSFFYIIDIAVAILAYQKSKKGTVNGENQVLR